MLKSKYNSLQTTVIYTLETAGVNAYEPNRLSISSTIDQAVSDFETLASTLFNIQPAELWKRLGLAEKPTATIFQTTVAVPHQLLPARVKVKTPTPPAPAPSPILTQQQIAALFAEAFGIQLPSSPTISLSPVNSTVLHSVGYDRSSKTLQLRFHSGKIYNYENVAESTYHSLVSSPSVGTYYNTYIKGKYEAVLVGTFIPSTQFAPGSNQAA